MTTIYRTGEWKGYGKQEYYWNEYRLDGDAVQKFRCHRRKVFDGRENRWHEGEVLKESWSRHSPDIPSWLAQYL